MITNHVNKNEICDQDSLKSNDALVVCKRENVLEKSMPTFNEKNMYLPSDQIIFNRPAFLMRRAHGKPAIEKCEMVDLVKRLEETEKNVMRLQNMTINDEIYNEFLHKLPESYEEGSSSTAKSSKKKQQNLPTHEFMGKKLHEFNSKELIKAVDNKLMKFDDDEYNSLSIVKGERRPRQGHRSSGARIAREVSIGPTMDPALPHRKIVDARRRAVSVESRGAESRWPERGAAMAAAAAATRAAATRAARSRTARKRVAAFARGDFPAALADADAADDDDDDDNDNDNDNDDDDDDDVDADAEADTDVYADVGADDGDDDVYYDDAPPSPVDALSSAIDAPPPELRSLPPAPAAYANVLRGAMLQDKGALRSLKRCVRDVRALQERMERVQFADAAPKDTRRPSMRYQALAQPKTQAEPKAQPQPKVLAQSKAQAQLKVLAQPKAQTKAQAQLKAQAACPSKEKPAPPDRPKHNLLEFYGKSNLSTNTMRKLEEISRRK